MKKLSKLKLMQNAELMDEDQMRMIVGGKYFYCECTGHAGSWEWNYDNTSSILKDIDKNCREGGTCIAL